VARRALAILAIHHLGHSVTDVAIMLQKHPGSASRWLETSRILSEGPDSVSKILELIPDLCADTLRM